MQLEFQFLTKIMNNSVIQLNNILSEHFCNKIIYTLENSNKLPLNSTPVTDFATLDK